jgi:sulfur-oxidizing protein SoxX
MKKTLWIAAVASPVLALLGCAGMQGLSDADAAKKAQDVMRASFVTSGIASADRLNQDAVQKTCTTYAGKEVPAEVAQSLQKAQLDAIVLPAEPDTSKWLGNWREGEKIAQNGRGLTFSDKAGEANGGNCYACHQIAPQEISYGNIGPSLYQYGKLRGASAEIVRYTYQKIYNAQAFAACSNMPRFGHQKILSEQQIKDLVALLLDPQSPVNQ